MSGSQSRIHRDPPEESPSLYPGLVVHDLRVGGRVTVGPSRVPLSVLVGEAFGFETPYVDLAEVEAEYGFNRREFANFLSDLLSAPGELARLLLVVAEAERRWRVELLEPYLAHEKRRARERVEPIDVSGGFGHSIDVSQLPGPWWQHPRLRAPIVAQLRRCLDVLGEEPTAAEPVR